MRRGESRPPHASLPNIPSSNWFVNTHFLLFFSFFPGTGYGVGNTRKTQDIRGRTAGPLPAPPRLLPRRQKETPPQRGRGLGSGAGTSRQARASSARIPDGLRLLTIIYVRLTRRASPSGASGTCRSAPCGRTRCSRGGCSRPCPARTADSGGREGCWRRNTPWSAG